VLSLSSWVSALLILSRLAFWEGGFNGFNWFNAKSENSKHSKVVKLDSLDEGSKSLGWNAVEVEGVTVTTTSTAFFSVCLKKEVTEACLGGLCLWGFDENVGVRSNGVETEEWQPWCEFLLAGEWNDTDNIDKPPFFDFEPPYTSVRLSSIKVSNATVMLDACGYFLALAVWRNNDKHNLESCKFRAKTQWNKQPS
jgi:hypothetical protein